MYVCTRILIALLLLACSSTAISQEEPSEEALAALNTAIADVRAEISRRNLERSAVYNTLQDSERALLALNDEIDDLERDIAANEARLETLAARGRELQALKSDQQEMIKLYVRSAWQNGRQEYFKLLLNQENPAQVSRVVAYYRYFSAARSEAVSEYNATLAEIREVAGRVSDTNAALDTQRQSLASRREDLQAGQRERQSLLDDLDVLLSSSARKLEALQAERDEMQLLVEELRRSITALSLGEQEQPFATLKGRLPWPVDGRMGNRWGGSVGLGDLSWEGVTLTADAGSDVRAIHHGRVVFSDWFSSSGLLLIIDHGDGYMSLYAHNQALFKDVGEWVSSGEVIASVGNTGGQGEPGLYFEIRHNGSSENPAVWCLARN